MRTRQTRRRLLGFLNYLRSIERRLHLDLLPSPAPALAAGPPVQPDDLAGGGGGGGGGGSSSDALVFAGLPAGGPGLTGPGGYAYGYGTGGGPGPAADKAWALTDDVADAAVELRDDSYQVLRRASV